METVICRWCDTTHELTSAKQCPGCGEILQTNRELMDRMAAINKTVNTLNAEIAVIRAELWNRKQRTQAVYFWEQPKPALFRAKPGSAGKRRLALNDIPDLL
jgi:hypothetical protein